MKTKTKKHLKIQNQISISISIPSDLIKVIDKIAAEENRTRSNYIAKVMSEFAKQYLSK